MRALSRGSASATNPALRVPSCSFCTPARAQRSLPDHCPYQRRHAGACFALIADTTVPQLLFLCVKVTASHLVVHAAGAANSTQEQAACCLPPQRSYLMILIQPLPLQIILRSVSTWSPKDPASFKPSVEGCECKLLRPTGCVSWAVRPARLRHRLFTNDRSPKGRTQWLASSVGGSQEEK